MRLVRWAEAESKRIFGNWQAFHISLPLPQEALSLPGVCQETHSGTHTTQETEREKSLLFPSTLNTDRNWMLWLGLLEHYHKYRCVFLFSILNWVYSDSFHKAKSPESIFPSIVILTNGNQGPCAPISFHVACLFAWKSSFSAVRCTKIDTEAFSDKQMLHLPHPFCYPCCPLFWERY